MLNAKIKQWVFERYIILILLGLIGSTIYFFTSLKGKDEITIFITMIGWLITTFYFIQKQMIEELKIFKEIFTEFNRRYDVLNEKVNKIASNDQKIDLTTEEINILNDYFNLCGEEFLFYRRGYIFPEVWMAWHNGMKYFLVNSSRIKEYWEKEKETESYYGLIL